MRARFLFSALIFSATLLHADQNVNIGPGNAFSPPDVTITPGETITWTWLAPLHSTTSDSPIGPEVWDSGVQNSGTFTHTFSTPGDYPYYCSVHSFPGGTMMNGIIRVSSPPPSLTVTQVSPPAGVPGITVTISGTGFVNGATVRFGVTGATGVIFVNDTTLTAQVPAIAPGTYDVTVTNPDTTSATLVQGFVVLDPAAAIPALSPIMLLMLAGALALAALRFSRT
jgi:plastocyanin